MTIEELPEADDAPEVEPEPEPVSHPEEDDPEGETE